MQLRPGCKSSSCCCMGSLGQQRYWIDSSSPSRRGYHNRNAFPESEIKGSRPSSDVGDSALHLQQFPGRASGFQTLHPPSLKTISKSRLGALTRLEHAAARGCRSQSF